MAVFLWYTVMQSDRNCSETDTFHDAYNP